MTKSWWLFMLGLILGATLTGGVQFYLSEQAREKAVKDHAAEITRLQAETAKLKKLADLQTDDDALDRISRAGKKLSTGMGGHPGDAGRALGDFPPELRARIEAEKCMAI